MEIKIDRKARAHLTLCRLDRMRSHPTKCSFKIKVKDGVVFAHREVLLGVSDYFEAMLSRDLKESQTDVLCMESYDPECVRICFDFIYGRTVSVKPDQMIELIHVAHMLQLGQLCSGIEQLMMKNINLETFYDMTKTADLLNCRKLLAKCLVFQQKNFTSIVRQKKFCEIDKEILTLMLRSDRSRINEESKLEAILKWVNHDQSRKNDLGLFLDNVKISQIPLKALQKLFEDKNLFQDSHNYVRVILSEIIKKQDLIRRYSKSFAFFASDRRNMLLYDPRENHVIETDIQKCDTMRAKYTIVQTDGDIYVLFGNKTLSRLRYLKSSPSWHRLPRMIDYHGLHPPSVVMSHDIYVIGGGGECYTRSCEVFRTLEQKWESLPSIPKTKDRPTLVSHQNCVYCLGGWLRDDVTKFDVKKSRWKAVAAMIEKREFPAAVAYGDNILVAGGFNGEGYVSSIERYEIEADQWTTFPSLNIARFRLQIYFNDGYLFAVGRRSQNCQTFEVEQFNNEEGEWKIMTLTGETNVMLEQSFLLQDAKT